MAETADSAIRAVLLDLGGVLIHIHFERALAHWAMAAGLPADAFTGRFEPDDAYARHERGECDFADYAAHLRRRLGVDIDDRAMLAGWNAVLGTAMPDAAALVTRLRQHFPLFLFSNSNAAHHACWSRDHAAMLRHFERVFVSHDLGLRKPEPAAFHAVVARLGVEPAAVAFFDDLAENVAGARRAGLTAFTVSGPADVARHLGLPPADPGA